MSKRSKPLPGLIEEHPILVYPKLAKAIGINESIICQQIHYILDSVEEVDKTYNYVDGKWWVYYTLQQWHDKYFEWLAVGSIGRILRNLEKTGLIQSMQSVKNPSDRTKWYTINYDKWIEAIPPMLTNCNDGSSLQNVTIKATNCNDGYDKTLVKDKDSTLPQQVDGSATAVDVTWTQAQHLIGEDFLCTKATCDNRIAPGDTFYHDGNEESILCVGCWRVNGHDTKRYAMDDTPPPTPHERYEAMKARELTDNEFDVLEDMDNHGLDTHSRAFDAPGFAAMIDSLMARQLCKMVADEYVPTAIGRAALEAYRVAQTDVDECAPMADLMRACMPKTPDINKRVQGRDGSGWQMVADTELQLTCGDCGDTNTVAAWQVAEVCPMCGKGDGERPLTAEQAAVLEKLRVSDNAGLYAEYSDYAKYERDGFAYKYDTVDDGTFEWHITPTGIAALEAWQAAQKADVVDCPVTERCEAQQVTDSTCMVCRRQLPHTYSFGMFGDTPVCNGCWHWLEDGCEGYPRPEDDTQFDAGTLVKPDDATGALCEVAEVKKPRKGKAKKKAHPLYQEMVQAIKEAFNVNDKYADKSDFGRIGKVANNLLEREAKPFMINRFYGWCKKEFDSKTLNYEILTKWYARWRSEMGDRVPDEIPTKPTPEPVPTTPLSDNGATLEDCLRATKELTEKMSMSTYEDDGNEN